MMSCPLPIVPVIQTLPTINSQPDYPIHIGIKVSVHWIFFNLFKLKINLSIYGI